MGWGAPFVYGIHSTDPSHIFRHDRGPIQGPSEAVRPSDHSPGRSSREHANSPRHWSSASPSRDLYRGQLPGRRSTADTLSKLAIAEDEADETLYRMEMLVEANIVAEDRLRDLMNEGDEIVAMTVASLKTLRDQQ